MRHRLKKHHLGKPADQRKALLRTLATSLFTHYEIRTTLVRAKALKEQSDKIVSFAKRGDLHAMRQVSKLIYDNNLGTQIADVDGRSIEETLLRRIFRTVAPRFADRNGGYTRVIQMPPRRGDASPMALVQLTFELNAQDSSVKSIHHAHAEEDASSSTVSDSEGSVEASTTSPAEEEEAKKLEDETPTTES